MREFTSKIRKFTSKTVHIKEVKLQFNVWKLGARFNNFNTYHSKSGKIRAAEELVQTLKETGKKIAPNYPFLLARVYQLLVKK